MTATLSYFNSRFGRNRRNGKTAVTVIVIVVLVVGLLSLLACGGIVAVLVGLLMPAVGEARTAARRMQSTNNLKQIGLALHNYHDVHGSFPPAYISDEDGNPMHSWRVLILPYVEEQYLYDQYDFDKPWDHPDNMAVTERMPYVYRSPFLEGADDGKTPYVAISAPDTVLAQGDSKTFGDITDGTSNTIVGLENYAKPVFWAEPTDISPDQILANFGRMVDNPQQGINLMMADGSIRFMTLHTNPAELEGGFYINDGRPLGP